MALTKVTARPEKELRIGLLGCGFMGKCHTNAYKKIPTSMRRPRSPRGCWSSAINGPTSWAGKRPATAMKNIAPIGRRWPSIPASKFSITARPIRCIRNRASPPCSKAST